MSTCPARSALCHRVRCSRGFTLIEVMIALGILAFGLLAVAVMQLEALRQGSGGWNTSFAAAIAWDQMEQIRRMPWAQVAPTAGFVTPPWINNPPNPPGVIAADVNSTTAGVQAKTLYTVSWRVNAIAGTTSLRGVDLLVSWTDPNRAQAKTLTLSSLRFNGSG